MLIDVYNSLVLKGKGVMYLHLDLINSQSVTDRAVSLTFPTRPKVHLTVTTRIVHRATRVFCFIYHNAVRSYRKF